jgi:large subunit ribosomal protein L20
MDIIKKAGVGIDRKMLSNLAIADPQAFKGLVDQAKAAAGAA